MGGSECAPLQRSLRQRLSGIRHRCLLLSAFISGSNVKRADARLATSTDQRAYALKVLETTLTGDARRHLLRLFEGNETSLGRSLNEDFPQQSMARDQRLALMIVPATASSPGSVRARCTQPASYSWRG